MTAPDPIAKARECAERLDDHRHPETTCLVTGARYRPTKSFEEILRERLEAATLLRQLAEENERLYTLAKANNDLARMNSTALAAEREKVGRMREALESMLSCTPHVMFDNGYNPYIEYDCGDPWEIARQALEEARDG